VLYGKARREKKGGTTMSLAQLTQQPVQTVQASSTVAEAARLMCTHSVGALVITDASEVTPLGIITDRDLVWMIAEGLDPQTATVDRFVRSPLRSVCVTESLSDVTRAMREHGVRRLPIVDPERRLLGIVALDDILLLLGKELADVAAAVRGELKQERHLGAGTAATGR
jgi:CBS domain-containing protein